MGFDADSSHERGSEDAPPGLELATSFADGLRRRGVEADVPEDHEWCWLVRAATDDGRWDLLIGLVGDDPGEARQWLVSVSPQKRGLLRRPALGLDAITPTLHAVATADLGLSPRWFTESEWNGPNFGPGSEDPLA